MSKPVAALLTCICAASAIACDYNWAPAEVALPDAQASREMGVTAEPAESGVIMRDAAREQPDADVARKTEDAEPPVQVSTAKECEMLQDPEHGQVSLPSGRAPGARAEYSCSTGYKLAGAAQRTCQDSGSWSSAAPNCEAVSCSALTDPKNGSVSLNGTEFGKSAQYACNKGFTLIGSATSNCQADGQWSSAAPSCECSSDLSSDAMNCGACGTRCASGACSASQCVRRVFLSSRSFAGNFGSLAEADAACQRLAEAASVPGTFKAWLSDGTNSPSTRFVKGNGEYRRIDNVKVASNFAALIGGTLEKPISVYESGQAAQTTSNTYVYTGTGPDGTSVVIPATDPNFRFGATCLAWTTNLPTAWGAYGSFATTAASWSYGGGRTVCSASLPIYCVEQ